MPARVHGSLCVHNMHLQPTQYGTELMQFRFSSFHIQWSDCDCCEIDGTPRRARSMRVHTALHACHAEPLRMGATQGSYVCKLSGASETGQMTCGAQLLLAMIASRWRHVGPCARTDLWDPRSCCGQATPQHVLMMQINNSWKPRCADAHAHSI